MTYKKHFVQEWSASIVIMEGSFATVQASASTRPMRKAAVRAQQAIQSIQAWENLPKNCSLLQEMAASIDQELSNEIQSGKVNQDDLDQEFVSDGVVTAEETAVGQSNENQDMDSDDEYFSACDDEESECEESYESSFVTDDDSEDGGESDGGEWVPMKKKKIVSDREEDEEEEEEKDNAENLTNPINDL